MDKELKKAKARTRKILTKKVFEYCGMKFRTLEEIEFIYYENYSKFLIMSECERISDGLKCYAYYNDVSKNPYCVLN